MDPLQHYLSSQGCLSQKACLREALVEKATDFCDRCEGKTHTMLESSELDVLRAMPGYKAIMRGVLKYQIQQLVEQLSSQTGDEAVILTASVSDGTLCHLGTVAGKNFLDGRDEIKSQFLRHCLKKQCQPQSQNTTGAGLSPSSYVDHGNMSGLQPSPQRRRTPGMMSMANQRLSSPSRGSPFRRSRPPRSSSLFGQHTPSKQRRTGFMSLPTVPPQNLYPESSPRASPRTPTTPVQMIDLSLDGETSLDTDGQGSEPSAVSTNTPSQDVGPTASIVDRLSPHLPLQGPELTPEGGNEEADPYRAETSQPSTCTSQNSSSLSATEVIDTSIVKVERVLDHEPEFDHTVPGLSGGTALSSNLLGGAMSGLRLPASRADSMDVYSNEAGAGNQSSSNAGECLSPGSLYRSYQTWTGTQDSSRLIEDILDGAGTQDSHSGTLHAAESGQLWETMLKQLGTGGTGSQMPQSGSQNFKAVFVCDQCQKVFKSKYSLQLHKRWHEGIRPFQCEFCQKDFIDKSNLRKHRRIHTGEKKYMCKFCGKTFSDPSNHSAHVRSHLRQEGERSRALEDDTTPEQKPVI